MKNESNNIIKKSKVDQIILLIYLISFYKWGFVGKNHYIWVKNYR